MNMRLVFKKTLKQKGVSRGAGLLFGISLDELNIHFKMQRVSPFLVFQKSKNKNRKKMANFSFPLD